MASRLTLFIESMLIMSSNTPALAEIACLRVGKLIDTQKGPDSHRSALMR
jgi:hypothetical protein